MTNDKYKFFYINMDKDVKRNRHMKKLLKGTDNTRITGVDVDNLKLKEYEDILKHVDKGTETLNKGQIGCTMSHIACLSTLAQTNCEVGIILEDDVEFSDGLNINDLYHAIEHAPPDWEFLTFALSDGHVIFADSSDYFLLTNTSDKNYGLMAYAMRPQTALRVYCSLPDKMTTPIDDWVRNNFFYRYRTYYCMRNFQPMMRLSFELFTYSSTAERNYNLRMLTRISQCNFHRINTKNSKVINEDNTIYIGNEGVEPFDPMITHLIQKAFPSKKIVARNYSPDLIIRRIFSQFFHNWNYDPRVKYIYISSEPYTIEPANSNDRLIFENMHVEGRLWYPFIMQTYITMSEQEVDLDIKDRFLCYCYTHKVPYRERIFDRACEHLPRKCWASGYCVGTSDKARIEKQDGRYDDVDYSRYYFVFAMENSYKPGYITEKVLIPAYQRCIPIYKGEDSLARIIFNPHRIVLISDFKSIEECLDYCLDLVNSGRYEEYISEPLFTEEGKHFLESIINTNAEIVKAFLES